MKRVSDRNDYEYESFFVTDKGIEWLLANQHKLNLKLHARAESDDYAIAAEISDDDIPF